ncbi:hypothetical protein HDU85_002627 [Gaertneriomyces sp. JEL0708]|nr:hypothetical protein HDU85_002627 [Gaertneriomyces sp. JEL0708]
MAKRKASPNDPDFEDTVTNGSSTSTSSSKRQRARNTDSTKQLSLEAFKFVAPKAKDSSAKGSAAKLRGPKAAVRKDTSAQDVGRGEDEPTSRKAKLTSALNGEYPPLHDLEDIFSDLAERVREIADVARKLNGRKLRVATMCSGTESPLLALNLISRAAKLHYGVNLEIEHVFSCEIEPFKQAYIERNFAPPLLFRDVCELGQDTAITAYGAEVPVPGNVDLLVAGTSCVDYSNLNNEKKGLHDKGQSGKTFRGMMDWVKRHRPPLIILENVLNAPWNQVIAAIEEADYRADWMRIDTKHYYIPHTRTRGYLFATSLNDTDLPAMWKKTVDELSRPASSPLEAFLLPADDPRIQRVREDLAQSLKNGRSNRRPDWDRCAQRHDRARNEEHLGQKRPLTAWEDGSICKLLDNSWNDWGRTQTERVLDLMDISYLRMAKTGVDPSYKTLVWNLSQNVDRTTASGLFSICPCLTPSMIPYITNRGGPLVGLEALSLQGLPINELLLTRESDDQLADLAGNAMTTTVVGTCILAALILSSDALEAGSRASEPAASLIQVANQPNVADISDLASVSLDLAKYESISLSEILDAAQKSARHCECEGRTGMAAATQICQDCGYSACNTCSGRPEHRYAPFDVARLDPVAFGKRLKTVLPMVLSVAGISASTLEIARERSSCDHESWIAWRDTVVHAVGETVEFRYRELKRRDIWTVTYEAPSAILELVLDQVQPEWRLFVKSPANEIVKSPLRNLLSQPVARMPLDSAQYHDLLSGDWSVRIPALASFQVELRGIGELVPSWEARLGLQGELERKEWWSQVEVTTISDEAHQYLEHDISGTYTLLEKCGTAMGALHKRCPETSGPPIYFFFDPTRSGDASQDSFVFSSVTRRLQYGEERPIYASLDSKWRPSASSQPERVRMFVTGKWINIQTLKLCVPDTRKLTLHMPVKTLEVRNDLDACASAAALFAGEVPLTTADAIWPPGKWECVDLQHKGHITFRSLAWITERLPPIPSLNQWVKVDYELESPQKRTPCQRCAPAEPVLTWVVNGSKTVPEEDPRQAVRYEQDLKHRPPPFVVQLRVDGAVGQFRIGVNLASLMHRALSRLPSKIRNILPCLSWKLTTGYKHVVAEPEPFQLSSNRHDPQHSQPPHFRKHPLRPEQLRSLSWMLAQESPDADPFIEEEISEALLEPLGWRAEGKAEQGVLVRGGVLADEVGYGKTAITVGLIDTARSLQAPMPTPIGGAIALKATLIVVPPHLVEQWPSEINKFVGRELSILKIADVKDLNRHSIADFMAVDIIVLASRIFSSDIYWGHLTSLAANGPLPSSVNGGRHFITRYEEILDALKESVDVLQEHGAARLRDRIRDARGMALATIVKSKRQRAVAETKDGHDSDDSGCPTKPAENKRPKRGVATKACSRARTSDAAPKETREIVPATSVEEASVMEESEDASDESLAEDEYEVDKILQHRRDEVRNVRQYLVHWKGYDDPSEHTWEDEVNLSGCKEIVHAYKMAAGLLATPRGVPRKVQALLDFSHVDSDDSDEEIIPMRRSKKKTAVVVDESDYEDPIGEEQESDDAIAESELEPEFEPASETEEEVDDEMEGEVKKFKSTKSTVRRVKAKQASKKPAKAIVDRKPAAIEVTSEEKDPWKFSASDVQRDWRKMKCPALEMFQFNRVVIDEFTYLKGREHAAITRLKSTFRWVLSGTPPVHDFNAVKGIAAFLGVHLGVDDYSDGSSDRRRTSELTKAEAFHSFREVHTPAWHARRREVAQLFLNKFVRQNIAEIDEIPSKLEMQFVRLPAAERAIYLELEHHLLAMEMNTRKGLKTKGDKERRVQEALGSSNSAEEALLKRCSHFDLGLKYHQEGSNAREACDLIVKERTDHFKECRRDLVRDISRAKDLHHEIMRKGGFPDHDHFRHWLDDQRKGNTDDPAVRNIMFEILEETGCMKAAGGKYSEDAAAWRSNFEYDGVDKDLFGTANTSFEGGTDQRTHTKSTTTGKGKRKVQADESESVYEMPTSLEDKVWYLRELVVLQLRRNVRELVGRVRSLRYFKIIRSLQLSEFRNGIYEAVCPGKFCSEENLNQDGIPIAELAVLSCCGHAGCRRCLRWHAEDQQCPVLGCRAQVRPVNVVLSESIEVEHLDEPVGKFGAKLRTLTVLIEALKEERTLVFVQFPDLMEKVAEALTDARIPFLQVKGTAHQKSKSLSTFQNAHGKNSVKVLLLNVMDESASGANLTVANNVIFLSPLLADTPQIYTACETQAIGRVRRYGQEKLVRIWRLLTTDTIDTKIYEDRHGRLDIDPHSGVDLRVTR